jgi:hypothetical protein
MTVAVHPVGVCVAVAMDPLALIGAETAMAAEAPALE